MIEARDPLYIYVNDWIVISIPILLLWRVQISLRSKLVLCGILCLSIFTMFAAIIDVAGGYSNHGQIDAVWAIFWQQAEAAVAIVIISATAYRAVFVAHRASKRQSPAKNVSNSRVHISNTMNKTHNNLPRAPPPTFAGVRTHVRHSPYDIIGREGAGDIELPLQEPGILVIQEISSEKVRRVFLLIREFLLNHSDGPARCGQAVCRMLCVMGIQTIQLGRELVRGSTRKQDRRRVE